MKEGEETGDIIGKGREREGSGRGKGVDRGEQREELQYRGEGAGREGRVLC